MDINKKKLDLAVCILFFEKVGQTKECVDSFAASGVKIYVLNNGSSEKSLAELKSYCRKWLNVVILEAGRNLGVSGGRNFIIKNTKEEWLFFVDNDITIKTKNWLEKIARHISDFPEADVFTPRLFNLPEREYNSWYSIALSDDRKIIRTAAKNGWMNIFPGGASVINRRIFDRFGLYDENMFVGFEDVEFGIRGILNKQEIKALIIRDIKLRHKHIQPKRSEDNLTAQVRYDIDRNRQSFEYLFQKHGLMVEADETWVAKKADYFINGKKFKSDKLQRQFQNYYYTVCGFLLKFKLVRIINNFRKNGKKEN